MMSNSDTRKRAAKLRQHQIRSKALQLDPGLERPRFVADVMLGRLAKWLRIAGFDVLYSNRYSDDELVALSHAEGRILLSRDTRLLVRKVVRRFVFLESDKIQDQIRQIFRLIGTQNLPDILSRCLSCNEVLAPIPRDGVKELVPPYVFATQPHFKSCPRCQRIYWAGTHREAVLRTLQALVEEPPQV
jgi:uncharacterized protein with PIN domain